MLGFDSNSELRKCFTYFSHLDDLYRNTKIDMHKMYYFELMHDETNYPLSFFNDNNLKLMYAIHSGNTIPQDLDQFDYINLYSSIINRFNRVKTNLLKAPFMTKCQDYDQTGEYIMKIENSKVCPCN